MATHRLAGWLAGFVFGLAPLMMLGVTGVRYMSASPVQVGLFAVLVVTLVVLIWSSATGRARTANVAGVVTAGLILSPYALAGPRGWRLYAVVTGLSILIIGPLFLSVMIHRFLFAWRPGTRVGASVRLVLDGAGALALMAAVFWPAFLHDLGRTAPRCDGHSPLRQKEMERQLESLDEQFACRGPPRDVEPRPRR